MGDTVNIRAGSSRRRLRGYRREGEQSLGAGMSEGQGMMRPTASLWAASPAQSAQGTQLVHD